MWISVKGMDALSDGVGSTGDAAGLEARSDSGMCTFPGAIAPGGKGGGGDTTFEDSHLLLGTSQTRGNVCVSPQLQKWLGEELGKEAMATKERRKAREERALAAPKA